MNWLIYFEDQSMRPEIFTSEESARARHTQLLSAWNCHLFQQVIPPQQAEKCPECIGDGWIIPDGLDKTGVDCPACNGTGERTQNA